MIFILRRTTNSSSSFQDIQNCTESTELLNELNAKGRAKIAALRSSIEKLEGLAFQEPVEKRKLEIYSEIDSHKSQLTITLAAFRNANVVSACVIDRMAKEELLGMPEEQQSALRKRRDKQTMIKMSGGITDKLLSISRHLAETTQKSAHTLDTLSMCIFSSSHNILITEGSNGRADILFAHVVISFSNIIG